MCAFPAPQIDIRGPHQARYARTLHGGVAYVPSRELALSFLYGLGKGLSHVDSSTSISLSDFTFIVSCSPHPAREQRHCKHRTNSVLTHRPGDCCASPTRYQPRVCARQSAAQSPSRYNYWAHHPHPDRRARAVARGADPWLGLPRAFMKWR